MKDSVQNIDKKHLCVTDDRGRRGSIISTQHTHNMKANLFTSKMTKKWQKFNRQFSHDSNLDFALHVTNKSKKKKGEVHSVPCSLAHLKMGRLKVLSGLLKESKRKRERIYKRQVVVFSKGSHNARSKTVMTLFLNTCLPQLPSDILVLITA